MQYSRPSAKIILDSISPAGARLTTLEVRMHRFVLAEFNTHRAFSRNAASSRAIPIAKRMADIQNDPAMPVEWGRNQKGMQAEGLLSPEEQAQAEAIWLSARDSMMEHTQRLLDLGVHKQLSNRLLEPWAWVTDIVSATEWENFFHQRATRYSKGAQPEMRGAADAVLEVMEASKPQPVPNYGWHLPYIQEDEFANPDLTLHNLKTISVARCARVSYLTHGGVRDIVEDTSFCNRLANADPMHSSPFEHVAMALPNNEIRSGNFTGWRQYRKCGNEHIYSPAYLPTATSD